MGPEVWVRALFRDQYVGMVRCGHPLSADGAVTVVRYVTFPHVATPHGKHIVQAIDAGLDRQGLRRTEVAVVQGFPAPLAVVCASDLVALLPVSFMSAQSRPGTTPTAACAHAFELPVPEEVFSISLLCQRAQAIAGPSQQFDDVATAATNTKTWPLNGSACSAVSTFAARPLKPQRYENLLN